MGLFWKITSPKELIDQTQNENSFWGNLGNPFKNVSKKVKNGVVALLAAWSLWAMTGCSLTILDEYVEKDVSDSGSKEKKTVESEKEEGKIVWKQFYRDEIKNQIGIILETNEDNGGFTEKSTNLPTNYLNWDLNSDYFSSLNGVVNDFENEEVFDITTKLASFNVVEKIEGDLLGMVLYDRRKVSDDIGFIKLNKDDHNNPSIILSRTGNKEKAKELNLWNKGVPAEYTYYNETGSLGYEDYYINLDNNISELDNKVSEAAWASYSFNKTASKISFYEWMNDNDSRLSLDRSIMLLYSIGNEYKSNNIDYEQSKEFIVNNFWELTNNMDYLNISTLIKSNFKKYSNSKNEPLKELEEEGEIMKYLELKSEIENDLKEYSNSKNYLLNELEERGEIMKYLELKSEIEEYSNNKNEFLAELEEKGEVMKYLKLKSEIDDDLNFQKVKIILYLLSEMSKKSDIEINNSDNIEKLAILSTHLKKFAKWFEDDFNLKNMDWWTLSSIPQIQVHDIWEDYIKLASNYKEENIKTAMVSNDIETIEDKS